MQGSDCISSYISRTCLCDLLSDFVVGRNGDREREKCGRVEDVKRTFFFFLIVQ